jgi:hypothetical protein
VSKFYNPQRTRNIYDPATPKPFKISRSKIDLFVDSLLKKEFDVHREAGTAYPLQLAYGLDVIPAQRDEIDVWRENFKGVQFEHAPTHLIVTGAIDDLWIDSAGNYIVVDYKATAKSEPVTALDQEWQDGYKSILMCTLSRTKETTPGSSR